MPENDRLDMLLRFIKHLDDNQVPYDLKSVRPDAVMVVLATPGKRWEVEFMVSDTPDPIEIECFTSNGRIEGDSILATLFAELEIPEAWR